MWGGPGLVIRLPGLAIILDQHVSRGKPHSQDRKVEAMSRPAASAALALTGAPRRLRGALRPARRGPTHPTAARP